MVEQTDIESSNSHDRTQSLTDWEITTTGNAQFENDEIQLSGNTSKSSRKLSTSHTTPSPQRQASNHSSTISGKNNLRDSLSYSVLSQEAKRSLEGTPRTSTPVPPTSRSPRGGQEKVSGVYHDGILSGMEQTKKLFHDSTTNNVDSTHAFNRSNIRRSAPLEFTTQNSHWIQSAKNHWYFDMLKQLEDLSWNYQTLETEYSFLERLMSEQKEDMEKAKSWNKHLRNQNGSSKAYDVY